MCISRYLPRDRFFFGGGLVYGFCFGVLVSVFWFLVSGTFALQENTQWRDHPVPIYIYIYICTVSSLSSPAGSTRNGTKNDTNNYKTKYTNKYTNIFLFVGQTLKLRFFIQTDVCSWFWTAGTSKINRNHTIQYDLHRESSKSELWDAVSR